ncbi:P63C domain-containing protein [Symbiobacterium terraclitae]|uniref:P63C domain-containing protein n=1 Tax=Symbiobacterium terraclitae TaxID=557451 RepID=UPI0035B543AC
MKKGETAMREQVLLKATHVGELQIGDAVIPCAVIENGWRVLTQRGFLAAIGRNDSRKGRQQDGDKTPAFLTAQNLKPFWDKGLRMPTSPIPFKDPRGGVVAYGYRAELLPAFCKAVLDARDAGMLHPKQRHIARRCDQLIRAFATVGIIALVDEATGYAKHPREYADLVALFVATELQPWVKRFPDDFFRELCRMRGWKYTCGPLGLPRAAAHYINAFVYDRLPPEVLAELRRLASTRNHARLHQGFSDNFGVKWLDMHLQQVVALMKAAQDWAMFRWLFKRVFPKPGDQAELWLQDAL